MRLRVPVRLCSHKAGTESGFWRPLARPEARRILAAAIEYDLVHKQPGRRNGPLGSIALDVLRLFARLVDFRSGRLDPSIDYIQRKLKRSRSAIVRALAALREHGFLSQRRRYASDGGEGRGNPPRQVSNAYALRLPPVAARLLGFFGIDPTPDDSVTAKATTADAVAAMERAEFAVSPLGQSVARFRGIFASSLSGLNPKQVSIRCDRAALDPRHL